MKKHNYYDLLGLKRDDSKFQIEKAYRERAKKLHPDKNKNPGANEQFQKLVEIYEVLINPEKRKEYDEELPAKKNPEPKKDLSFDEIIKGNWGKEYHSKHKIVWACNVGNASKSSILEFCANLSSKAIDLGNIKFSHDADSITIMIIGDDVDKFEQIRDSYIKPTKSFDLDYFKKIIKSSSKYDITNYRN